MSKFLVALTFLLSMTSCLIYEQEITIRKDGSAHLFISYSIDTATLDTLSDLEVAMSELEKRNKNSSQLRYFDEALIKAHLKSFKGVETKLVRVFPTGDRTATVLRVEIDDFRKSLNEGLIPYMTLQPKKSNWLLSCSTPFHSDKKLNPEAIQRLDSLNIKIKISTPGDIISSSAKGFSTRKVIWHYAPTKETKASKIPSTFHVEYKSSSK